MIVYLGIPYTFDPEWSFQAANKMAAGIMRFGVDEDITVFSPISHSHPIAEHLPKNLVLDHSFWMKMDLPILMECDALLVIEPSHDQEAIKKSRGLQKEIATALQEKIPVVRVSESTDPKEAVSALLSAWLRPEDPVETPG